MRSARLLAVFTLVCLSTSARAQTPPFDSTVAVPEVDVRSGPSPQFYATSKLRMGERVRVVGEEGGYFAIVPPAGSLCWIENRVLEMNPDGKSATVLADEVPVRVGSNVSSVEPTVIAKNKLVRGTAVVIVGPVKVDSDGARWWPIAPQPETKEVRYVPKDTVRVNPPVESIAGASPGGNPAPIGSPAPAVPLTPEALYQQARQAEAAGDLTRAMDLYRQLANQTADFNQRNAYLNYAEFLRTRSVASVPAGYQPGVPAQAQYGETRLAPAPAVLTSKPATPVAGYGPPATPTQSSGPGHLRRAAFFVDGRQAYVLTDSLGRPLMYVTAQPGSINLELYLNHAVELYGPIVYRGDLRTNYIVASQVRQLQ